MVRGKGSKYTRVTIPTVLHVREGHSLGRSIDTLSTGLFKGCPWRLVGVSGQMAVSDTSRSSGVAPAVVQIRLNTAMSANVEGAMTMRRLVGITPQRFALKMPSPNPWKEDEQRTQVVLIVDNIKVDEIATVVTVLMNIDLEFGPVPFDAPSVSVHHSSPPASSGAQSPGDGGMVVPWVNPG